MNLGKDIRDKFLKFFESKGHTIVPSSSLIPDNDPTLMFTAAGMVQFKNVFTGVDKRAYSRAASCQRCVRAGGKHNDLENVGHTARHHTFFEMLGNFSFGDYFKEDAIPYAWEFLTSPEWLGIPKEKLYVTVYHTDDEAYSIWQKKVGIDEDRIIRISTSDNFWSAGDTGPCGPCTEIFYDHGEKYWGGLPGTPEEDGDRFIEIWNIVFMQYERQEDGELQDLPKKGVDTGAGLERLTAVMQHVNANYDTDLLQGVIQSASQMSGVKYHSNDSDISEEQRAESDSLRVIADHLRAMSFLITDGVMPSNEGPGYVLRRIMRRAIRHASLLSINEPFIHQLVPSLVDTMGDHYSELKQAQQMVIDTIKNEEVRFLRTLKNGLKLLLTEVESLKDGEPLSGEVAFKLHDTYGFPVDLTQDALSSKNIAVDVDKFNQLLDEQRRKTKEAGLGGTGQSKLAPVWYQLKDQFNETEFVGYDSSQTEAKILSIIVNDNAVDSIAQGDTAILVTDKTPFYAQSGGQVGDTGLIESDDGFKAIVTNTQKVIDNKIYQHFIEVKEGLITTGQSAQLKINDVRRNNIKNNHTATHILHSTLRNTLGDHVFQKGSEVSDSRLRFDFTHNDALTSLQIDAIEKIVNHIIWNNLPVSSQTMDKDEAIKKGAMALFGEKYDSDVRVVSIGDIDLSPDSIELCGGTHVNQTGDIGLFKILSESGISAGIRRIEALTGEQAFQYLSSQESLVKTISSDLSTPANDIMERIAGLQAEIKKLKQDVKKAKQSGGAQLNEDQIISKSISINGTNFIAATFEGVEPKDLRELALSVKSKIESGIVLLASNNDDKSAFAACLTKDLTSKFKAGEIVNIVAQQLGGKGGGRPDVAMAGGNSGDLDSAISTVVEKIGC